MISLGGGGTAIATAAMRALPLGFPKLMVSTLASGNTAHYLGTKDIVMMPSIVDVAGLNRISRVILTRAAGAICGMVEGASATETAAAGRQTARRREHVRQHDGLRPGRSGSWKRPATRCSSSPPPASGGRTMESLIESGMVAGVLDLTTTEWADELVGGVLTAGPEPAWRRRRSAKRARRRRARLPGHGELRRPGHGAGEVPGRTFLLSTIRR